MRALVTMNQPYKIEQETVSDPRSIEKSKDVDLLTAFISASCNTDAGKPKKNEEEQEEKEAKTKKRVPRHARVPLLPLWLFRRCCRVISAHCLIEFELVAVVFIFTRIDWLFRLSPRGVNGREAVPCSSDDLKRKTNKSNVLTSRVIERSPLRKKRRGRVGWT